MRSIWLVLTSWRRADMKNIRDVLLMKDPPTARLKPLPQSPVYLWNLTSSCQSALRWSLLLLSLLHLLLLQDMMMEAVLCSFCLSSLLRPQHMFEWWWCNTFCEWNIRFVWNIQFLHLFPVICSSTWSQTHRQRKHGIISASPTAAEVWMCNWHFKLILLDFVHEQKVNFSLLRCFTFEHH